MIRSVPNYSSLPLGWFKSRLHLKLLAASLCCSLGASPLPAQIAKFRVHTIGDSTVQFWPAAHYPKAGWGQVIPYFFNSNQVVFCNAAAGGTSSRSYYDRLWTNTLSQIGTGDMVLIQFGINDMSTNPAVHTEPMSTFKEYLTKYVDETKAKGAFPFLITPIQWNKLPNGGSWGLYPEAIRQLSASNKVPLIDLDAASAALRNSVGTNYSSQLMYMNLPAGVYSNYPAGSLDNTHLQEMGAIEMARLVTQSMYSLQYDTNARRLMSCLSPVYEATFIADTSAGWVTRNEHFPAGVTVTAVAVAYPGFTFACWSGDLSATNRVASFVMGTAAKTVTANFRANTRN